MAKTQTKPGPNERECTPLVAEDGARVGAHEWEPGHWILIQAAIASQRPILVYGEPGCGKSQLSRAAAARLRRLFVSHVVDAQTQARELLYDVDLVERLGRAQAMAVRGAAGRDPDQELAVQNFVRPGPLWWGLNPTAAEGTHAKLPPQMLGAERANGVVVLIDEIDKADPSVANGLLGVLGDRSFAPPGFDPIVQDGPFPLIILTSNEERTLPPAFVRRCWVLRIDVPGTKSEFTDYLVRRGTHHFDGAIDIKLLRKIANLTWEHRAQHEEAGLTPPGQAEYLDLLRAIHPALVDAKSGSPEKLADQLAEYVFKKHLHVKE